MVIYKEFFIDKLNLELFNEKKTLIHLMNIANAIYITPLSDTKETYKIKVSCKNIKLLQEVIDISKGILTPYSKTKEVSI